MRRNDIHYALFVILVTLAGYEILTVLQSDHSFIQLIQCVPWGFNTRVTDAIFVHWIKKRLLQTSSAKLKINISAHNKIHNKIIMLSCKLMIQSNSNLIKLAFLHMRSLVAFKTVPCFEFQFNYSLCDFAYICHIVLYFDIGKYFY